MGFIVAANPLGQFIFSPIFGWWANKAHSIRTPFVVSLLVFIIFSGVYSSLDIVEHHVKYYMALARFFVGVSSANVGKFIVMIVVVNFVMLINAL
jgi:ceroid-lipofuscinosis MFS transporter 7